MSSVSNTHTPKCLHSSINYVHVNLAMYGGLTRQDSFGIFLLEVINCGHSRHVSQTLRFSRQLGVTVQRTVRRCLISFINMIFSPGQLESVVQLKRTNPGMVGASFTLHPAPFKWTVKTVSLTLPPIQLSEQPVC